MIIRKIRLNYGLEKQIVTVSRRCVIVRVGLDEGDVPCFWVRTQEVTAECERVVLTIDTNEPWDESKWTYQGSWSDRYGDYNLLVEKDFFEHGVLES